MSLFFKLAKTVSNISISPVLKIKLIAIIIKINNALIDMKKSSKVHLSGLQELDEIIIKSQERTVINDHLSSLFIESLRTNPKLIVELGVETGQSTFALERVVPFLKPGHNQVYNHLKSLFLRDLLERLLKKGLRLKNKKRKIFGLKLNCKKLNLPSQTHPDTSYNM